MLGTGLLLQEQKFYLALETHFNFNCRKFKWAWVLAGSLDTQLIQKAMGPGSFPGLENSNAMTRSA